MKLDYKAWPGRRMFVDKPCPRHLQILESTLKAISKKVFPRQSAIKSRPPGLHFTWHYQVYLFLHFQLRQEKEGIKGPDPFTGIQTPLLTRKALVQKIAQGGGWGRRVQERILAHEVMWVKKRIIPEPGRGKYKKVISLLENPETILAVRQYIGKVGDSKFTFLVIELLN